MLVQMATRIDQKVKKALDDVSRQLGIKLNRLIEEALLDKLEEFMDSKEVSRLKKEPARSFEAVVEDLKKHGKI